MTNDCRIFFINECKNIARKFSPSVDMIGLIFRVSKVKKFSNKKMKNEKLEALQIAK